MILFVANSCTGGLILQQNVLWMYIFNIKLSRNIVRKELVPGFKKQQRQQPK